MLTAILLIGFFASDSGQPVCRQLDNGLKLFILEDHSLPLVSVQLWFGIGQANDPPGRPGLVAIGHDLLENTETGSPESNPASGVLYQESILLRDACYFGAVTTPDSLAHVLRREARRLRTPGVSDAALADALRRANDRNRVDGGWGESQNESRLLAALFPGHPYGYPPGFVGEGLHDISPEEATEFLSRRFTPANATIFVMGDVSAERVLEQMQAFGEGERIDPPAPPAYPRAPAETARVEPVDADAPALNLAWRTAPLGFFENAAVDVLMERLCNPIDGSLHRRLLELKYRAPTWQHWSAADAGVLTLTITRDNEFERQPSNPNAEKIVMRSDRGASWESIIALVDEELERAVAENASPIELNRARAQAARGLIERRVTFHQRMREIAEHQMVAGDFALAKFALARVAAVDVGDVREAALTLQESRRAIYFSRLERASSQSANALLTPHSLSAENAETREERISDRIKATFHRTPGRGLAEIRTILVSARATSLAGRAAIDRGTKTLPAARLRDYLSYHGLDLALLEEDGRIGFRSRGPVEKLDAMCEIHAGLAESVHADTVELIIAADASYEQMRGGILEAGF